MSLGTIRHEIRYPGQPPDQPPIVDGWESVEAAPGGYVSMAGKIDADRVARQPGLYRQGATWIASHAESGTCVGKGYILPPAIQGGVASLVARGLSFKADRQVDRLLYASRFYGDWITADSDPFALANASWEYDSSGGKLRISIAPGTHLTSGNNGGFVFAAPSADPTEAPNSITRILFQMHTTSADFEWRLYVYDYPDTLVGVEPTTFPCVDGDEVDYALTLQGNVVFLRLHSTATRTVSTAAEVYWVNNMDVLGIADSPSFSADQVNADIAGRLGFATSLIAPSSDSVMPLDVKQGTFADASDYVDVLTGRRTLWTSYNGETDVCDAGAWNTRQWFLPDAEAPFTAVPAELFDCVRIPYALSPGSSVTQIETVELPAGTSPLPFRNTFGDISVQTPLPDRATAQTMGLSILEWLSTPRYAGNGTVAEVLDRDGSRVSAHLMRAGDVLFTPAGVVMRISGLVRKADGVNWTADGRVAALDSLLARRQEQLALKGLVG